MCMDVSLDVLYGYLSTFMAYIIMAYIVMADTYGCVLGCPIWLSLYIYGLYNYGLYSYGRHVWMCRWIQVSTSVHRHGSWEYA